MEKVFCTNCGTEINTNDKFCPSCGGPQGVDKPIYQPYSTSQPMYALEQTRQHIKILGMVELAFGIITIVIVCIAIPILSIVLSPEFLQSAGEEISPDRESVLSMVRFILGVIFVFIGFSGIIDIIGGTLLLRKKKSGKIFTYISAVFSLLNIPIGTIYAVGAFWVLTKPETDHILE